jgi:hypothetical protein
MLEELADVQMAVDQIYEAAERQLAHGRALVGRVARFAEQLRRDDEH